MRVQVSAEDASLLAKTEQVVSPNQSSLTSDTAAAACRAAQVTQEHLSGTEH